MTWRNTCIPTELYYQFSHSPFLSKSNKNKTKQRIEKKKLKTISKIYCKTVQLIYTQAERLKATAKQLFLLIWVTGKRFKN